MTLQNNNLAMPSCCNERIQDTHTKTEETIVAQTPISQAKAQGSLSDLMLTGLPMALFVFILAACALVAFLNSFLCVCKPNEVVVLSGSKRKNKRGQVLGYRVLTGGRGIRIPILETIKRIDVTDRLKQRNQLNLIASNSPDQRLKSVQLEISMRSRV